MTEACLRNGMSPKIIIEEAFMNDEIYITTRKEAVERESRDDETHTGQRG